MNIRENVQKEGLDVALANLKCGLNISMGVGKTRVGVKYIKATKAGSVLISVPKNSVIETWKEEFKKMNLIGLLDIVEFVNYRSLHLKNPKAYDVVILDECHNLKFKHHVFFHNYLGRVLGLTGTPPEIGERKKMVDAVCPIKYTFTVDEATDNSILNDYKIFIHKIPLSKNKNILKNSKKGQKWFTSEVNDYDYFTDQIENTFNMQVKMKLRLMRMKAMMEYKSKEDYVKEMLKHIKDKTLVFANTHKQVDRICEYTYHSTNPNSDANFKNFVSGNINQLGAVLQLSEGINIPNLKVGIIMHAYGNEVKSAQRINIPVLLKSL